MKTLKLTKGYETIVCDCHYDIVKNYKWSASVSSRTQIRAVRGTNSPKKIYLMHREIMSAPKGMEVDHIDGNTLNNQCNNLRICTRSENMANLGIRTDSTSGHKGVHWYKQTRRWHSQITRFGKKHHLGFYKSKQDAIDAYHIKAEELFGSYGRKCC